VSQSFRNRTEQAIDFAALGIFPHSYTLRRALADIAAGIYLASISDRPLCFFVVKERMRTMIGMLLSWLVAVIFACGPVAESSASEADAGKELFLKYCASCHGVEAKGNGPVSRDLAVKVPDLTLLRSKNKGIYPTDRVMSSIDGSRLVRAHGDRTMPVWGEIFRREHEKDKYTELTSLLKPAVSSASGRSTSPSYSAKLSSKESFTPPIKGPKLSQRLHVQSNSPLRSSIYSCLSHA
jgi:mono/diheme cytochrome c family protein